MQKCFYSSLAVFLFLIYKEILVIVKLYILLKVINFALANLITYSLIDLIR